MFAPMQFGKFRVQDILLHGISIWLHLLVAWKMVIILCYSYCAYCVIHYIIQWMHSIKYFIVRIQSKNGWVALKPMMNWFCIAKCVEGNLLLKVEFTQDVTVADFSHLSRNYSFNTVDITALHYMEQRMRTMKYCIVCICWLMQWGAVKSTVLQI